MNVAVISLFREVLFLRVGKIHDYSHTQKVVKHQSFFLAFLLSCFALYIFSLATVALFNYRGTIFTEYTIQMMHQDAGSIALHSLLSYNHFRMAWYSYLGLLNINYADGFTCINCKNTPKILIMDATTLAFRKELDSRSLFLPENTTFPLRAGR